MDVTDSILKEFFPGKKLSFILRKLAKWAVGQDILYRCIKEAESKNGIEWLVAVAERLRIHLDVDPKGYNNLPRKGPVIIVANHPTVIDGLGLIVAVSSVRHDIKIVANHVLTYMLPKTGDLTIGIRNMQGKMSAGQYREMNTHLKKGGVLIIFPSGRLAGLQRSGLQEAPWNSVFLHLAKKNNAILVPVNIKGLNSWRYYMTAKIWRPFSNLMIIRECLRHKGKSLQIKILQPINVSRLDINRESAAVIAASFPEHIEKAGKNLPGTLPVLAPVAAPVNKQRLNAMLTECEVLKTLRDGKSVLLYRHQGEEYSPVLRELGRLREISFRDIGAGTGNSYDNDVYDKDYQHIIVWDPEQQEIAGSYRFVLAGEQLSKKGLKGLYSNELFNYKESFLLIASQSIEIGRGFIQKQYQKTHVLDALWKGIFHVALKHKNYKYLLGVLTIPQDFPEYAKKLMMAFFQSYLSSDEDFCSPSRKYSNVDDEEIANFFSGENFNEEWKKLNTTLREQGCDLPWPYKQAAKWYSTGGSKLLCFVEDESFNSIAGLNICEINKLKENYGKRYLIQE
ncbi:lysophospholipid acyltransferase family protein [Pantoea sp. FN0307]|uniref:lysophospholipid acyltransferase family protein n=1 Tax=Pantoea sp. FN0307 TaxID=3418560 RepID=UPI003CE69E9F